MWPLSPSTANSQSTRAAWRAHWARASPRSRTSWQHAHERCVSVTHDDHLALDRPYREFARVDTRRLSVADLCDCGATAAGAAARLASRQPLHLCLGYVV